MWEIGDRHVFAHRANRPLFSKRKSCGLVVSVYRKSELAPEDITAMRLSDSKIGALAFCPPVKEDWAWRFHPAVIEANVHVGDELFDRLVSALQSGKRSTWLELEIEKRGVLEYGWGAGWFPKGLEARKHNRSVLPRRGEHGSRNSFLIGGFSMMNLKEGTRRLALLLGAFQPYRLIVGVAFSAISEDFGLSLTDDAQFRNYKFTAISASLFARSDDREYSSEIYLSVDVPCAAIEWNPGPASILLGNHHASSLIGRGLAINLGLKLPRSGGHNIGYT